MITVTELNEFTWDMVRALPRVNYFIEKNEEVKVICKKNLESLYSEFTEHVESVDKFNPYNDNETYNNYRPKFTKEYWLPPDLKTKWKNYLFFDKPTIVIQNKYTLEWGRGPYNYFNINFLDTFFLDFKSDYQIIYIRPFTDRKDYYTDENKMLKFLDYEFIEEKHPEVITIKDVLRDNPNLNFNTAQFAIHATSNKHLTPSGGNACLSAYFGGDLIIFDTYNANGPLRGVWKTDSWLKYLGNSKVYGFTTYDEILKKTKEIWKTQKY